jgi:hypothetical protein
MEMLPDVRSKMSRPMKKRAVSKMRRREASRTPLRE